MSSLRLDQKPNPKSYMTCEQQYTVVCVWNSQCSPSFKRPVREQYSREMYVTGTKSLISPAGMQQLYCSLRIRAYRALSHNTHYRSEMTRQHSLTDNATLWGVGSGLTGCLPGFSLLPSWPHCEWHRDFTGCTHWVERDPATEVLPHTHTLLNTYMHTQRCIRSTYTHTSLSAVQQVILH